MKLVKLYCNDSRFKTVTFSSGFNIIMGEITDSSNMDKDSHNLGKTTLIDLIDFMLLKKLDKNNFLKKDKFINHVFFLEIQLNNKSYLTIRRSIARNTKISFKLSSKPYNDFSNELNWDYYDLPLSTKDDSINPKKILNSLLSFNVLSNYSYRDFLNYFLRTQNDYNDEFHLSKYSGSDSEWKPQVFDLLGFNANLLRDKYTLDSDFAKQKQYIERLKKENKIDSSEVDKLKGLIQIKENERNKINNSLSKLNFYLDEKRIDKTLVDDIESQISELNKKRYSLNLDLKSLQTSFDNNISFDLEATEKIFNEAKIYFTDQLKKSYTDLIKFNEMLTEDRNKFIESSIDTKIKQLKNIDATLTNLNNKKLELIDILVESDIFKKYKAFEKDLINLERDLEKLNIMLDSLSIIEKEEGKLKDIQSDIESAKATIKNVVDAASELNSLYNKIRTSFTEYVKYVIDKNALISIKQNGSGNVDFKAEILSDANEITAQDRGHTYKKILCACFDLSILINYSEKSFFKFIYHDGVLESLDPRKQLKYLNLVSTLCAKYDIQYILTAIESDIPTPNELNTENDFFTIPLNIAVKLSDESDSTNLFGFTF